MPVRLLTKLTFVKRKKSRRLYIASANRFRAVTSSAEIAAIFDGSTDDGGDGEKCRWQNSLITFSSDFLKQDNEAKNRDRKRKPIETTMMRGRQILYSKIHARLKNPAYAL